MKLKSMSRHHRRNSGSILLLVLFIICFLVLPAMVALSQLALYQVDKTRTESVIDAAGLVAANDLSRLIINDPNFGYVSLSNYPPIGKATCAPDGEPLPVVGINTLVGTVRQNTIVAHELDNSTMLALADRDNKKIESTVRDLNAAIKSALSQDSKSNWRDIQGARIEAVKDVTTFLQANLPHNIRLESVRLTSGWLSDGGDTTVAVPQPLRLAQVKSEAIRGGKYQAFSNIPACGRAFTFAGLGASSSLVNSKSFQEADGKHICSIVKIECIVTRENLGPVPFGLHSFLKMYTVACCQPYSMQDIGPTGAMTLRFSGGPVPGLQSWRDFLSGGFHDNQITTYDAVGGDYPVDHEARMIVTAPPVQPDTSQQFAQHLYYWLRNGHLRPRIDAVLDMMSASFRSGPAQIYAYEFARDGSISRRIIARDPFPVGVTSDSQMQTVSDTSIQGGLTPIIVFRDDVKNLGTIYGGRHAGQPLAGYPLNWCELAEYGGDEHLAAGLAKGRLGTKLTMLDPLGTAAPEVAINDPNFSLFQTLEGKTLALQPRRSFYSGGLALDIEIGGTCAPGTFTSAAPAEASPQSRVPLPAILDIPNKRYIFANRKI